MFVHFKFGERGEHRQEESREKFQGEISLGLYFMFVQSGTMIKFLPFDSTGGCSVSVYVRNIKKCMGEY